MKLGPNPAPLSPSEEILRTASHIIHGERADAYGSAEESFDRIAALWAAYLDADVSGWDVAMLMVLLKVSRAVTDRREDTLVDIAGYAALAARLRERL